MISLLPGSRLGRYQIRQKIGDGASGFVFRAHDPALDREIALKVLVPNRADRRRSRARFRQEALAIAKLDHPGILRVHDFGEDKGFYYLITTYVRGGTLQDRLGKKHPLDEVLPIALALADALDYAHRRGVVHRDLKPSNVLLDPDGAPMIADFGMARVLDHGANITRSGWILGTPEYMSPEQVLGEPADHRSDIYSFGVIVYELLLARPPFRKESPMATLLAHVRGSIPSPRQLDPGLERRVEAALLKALARDPRERYQTARDLVADLASTATVPGSGIRDTDDDAGSESPRPRGREPKLGTASQAFFAAPTLPADYEESAIRVFLVEDHLVLLEGLRPLIECNGGLEVVGGAQSAEEALSLLKTVACDVVVMDINLQGMNGLEATRRIKELSPQTKVLILSGHGGAYVDEAITAGADGYIVKSAGGEKLRLALHEVYAGGMAIDPTLTKALFRQGHGHTHAPAKNDPQPSLAS